MVGVVPGGRGGAADQGPATLGDELASQVDVVDALVVLGVLGVEQLAGAAVHLVAGGAGVSGGSAAVAVGVVDVGLPGAAGVDAVGAPGPFSCPKSPRGAGFRLMGLRVPSHRLIPKSPFFGRFSRPKPSLSLFFLRVVAASIRQNQALTRHCSLSNAPADQISNRARRAPSSVVPPSWSA